MEFVHTVTCRNIENVSNFGGCESFLIAPQTVNRFMWSLAMKQSDLLDLAQTQPCPQTAH